MTGFIAGIIIAGASILLPLTSYLQGDDAGNWLALSIQQFGAVLDAAGWAGVGVVVALLGMVVAILAFVGMRETAFASAHRRDLIRDSAEYLMVLATGLSTVLTLTILFSVIPEPLFTSLAKPGLANPWDVTMTLDDPDTAGTLTGQIAHVLMGFLSLGLLAACVTLDAAVRAWANDEDDAALSEDKLFEARIDARARRLKAVQDEANTIRTRRPSWKAVALRASGHSALLVMGTIAIYVLLQWPFDAPSDWLARTLSIAIVACLHLLLVSSSIFSFRKALAGNVELNEITARRWRLGLWVRGALVVMAIAVVPALLALPMLLSGEPVWSRNYTVFTLILFACAVILWVRRGKNSWREAALIDVERLLRASIQDDEARLARILDDPAALTATPLPAPTPTPVTVQGKITIFGITIGHIG